MSSRSLLTAHRSRGLPLLLFLRHHLLAARPPATGILILCPGLEFVDAEHRADRCDHTGDHVVGPVVIGALVVGNVAGALL